jgi:proteic killer suppression protein
MSRLRSIGTKVAHRARSRSNLRILPPWGARVTFRFEDLRGIHTGRTPVSSYVIQSFHDDATADLFNGKTSPAARRACPIEVWPVARRKLDLLHNAVSLSSLRFPPGNRLEALRGGRAGQHSIRINQQYRICFVWTDQGPAEVVVTDYH